MWFPEILSPTRNDPRGDDVYVNSYIVDEGAL